MMVYMYLGSLGHADNIRSLKCDPHSSNSQATIINDFWVENFLQMNAEKCELAIASDMVHSQGSTPKECYRYNRATVDSYCKNLNLEPTFTTRSSLCHYDVFHVRMCINREFFSASCKLGVNITPLRLVLCP